MSCVKGRLNGVLIHQQHLTWAESIWERQIRTVRKVLDGVTKQQTMDDEGLATVMCLAESIINGRPLTVASDDVNDLEP